MRYAEIIAEAASPEELAAFRASITSRYDVKVFDVYLLHGDLRLSSIIVGAKKQGIGTAVMNELCQFADQHGLRTTLSPATKDDHHGTTSRARLFRFYRRFGFVQNKGRTKDFRLSDSMFRLPKKRNLTEANIDQDRSKFWYNVATGKTIWLGGSDHHAHIIYYDPELFGFTQDKVAHLEQEPAMQDVDDEDPDEGDRIIYAPELFWQAMQRGWVRGGMEGEHSDHRQEILHPEGLYLEGKSLRDLARAAREIAQEAAGDPDFPNEDNDWNVETLRLTVRTGPEWRDERSVRLGGERAQFFMKTGRLPGQMMQEAFDDDDALPLTGWGWWIYPDGQVETVEEEGYHGVMASNWLYNHVPDYQNDDYDQSVFDLKEMGGIRVSTFHGQDHMNIDYKPAKITPQALQALRQLLKDTRGTFKGYFFSFMDINDGVPDYRQALRRLARPFSESYKLKELFDQPNRVKWRDRDVEEWLGHWRIGDTTYFVKMVNMRAFWNIAFGIIGERDQEDWRITGTGNQFAVLSTVINALKQFIAKVKPIEIRFSGADKRGPVYQRMLDKLMPQLPDYKLDTYLSNPRVGRKFVLTRREEIIGENLLTTKKEIGNRLKQDVSDEEREELLQHHGILDDMQFDDDGNLVIYRMLSVSPQWIKETHPGSRLGIYWSHDPQSASPYNNAGDKGVWFLIKALLAPEHQDWEGIMHFHHQGENEVRLEDGTPVRVIAVWADGKPLTLSNWIGHSFTA